MIILSFKNIPDSYVEVGNYDDGNVSYYYDTKTKYFYRYEFTGEEYLVDEISPDWNGIEYDELIETYGDELLKYIK